MCYCDARFAAGKGRMSEIATTQSDGHGSLEAAVGLALDEARSLGVDQAEAAVSHDVGLSATARLGEVEHLEYTNDRGVGVTVFCGNRKGSASTSNLSPTAIRETVAKAFTFARYTAEDTHAGLADPSLMAREIPDLQLDHPWALDADAAIELAIGCEAAALSHDSRITNSEGATVWTNRGIRVYGNTHGFVGSYAKTGHGISCAVLSDAGGDMQRDYYYTATRDPGDLESAAQIGRTAAKRAIGRLGASKIATTKAPVIFIPELARGFVGHAMGAITGGAQYRRSSFLLDAAGETIFPEFINVEERPHIPKGMASVPYDAEGVGTWDRDIVANGVLQAYILSSYSARRLGLETTANAGGAQNLVVPGTVDGLEDLLAAMGTGLLVEELIGQGVNAVTGDYSRGAVGHWVENGEITGPVHEVTIAGNLRDLYPRIIAIGRDQDLRGGIRCGSLLVDGFTIAGN
jgi:PmbA protein